MTTEDFQAAVIQRFDAMDARFDAIDQRFDTFRQEVSNDLVEMAADINQQFIVLERREDAAHAAIGKRLEAIDERLRNQ